jgi:hypothetical protein
VCWLAADLFLDTSHLILFISISVSNIEQASCRTRRSPDGVTRRECRECRDFETKYLVGTLYYLT